MEGLAEACFIIEPSKRNFLYKHLVCGIFFTSVILMLTNYVQQVRIENYNTLNLELIINNLSSECLFAWPLTYKYFRKRLLH